jgi:hypothetical protein
VSQVPDDLAILHTLDEGKNDGDTTSDWMDNRGWKAGS